MNLVLLRFFVLVMVLLLVLGGCCRKAVPSSTTEVSDSIMVKEVPRFIPVPVPGDIVEVERLVECDSVTNKPKPLTATGKGKRSGISVSIDSTGRLRSTAVCDSLHMVVEARDREIYRLRREKKEVERPVYVTTEFDKICRVWFAITVTILIATIVNKLRR